MRRLFRAFLILAFASVIGFLALTFLATGKERKPKSQLQTENTHNKVIILTYMRSGSSLTGDMLQQHPNVFYFYEPLWRLQHTYDAQSEAVLQFFNGTTMSMTSLQDLWQQKLHAMTNVLNCSFLSMDVGSFAQAFMNYSKTTIPYIECLEQQQKLGIELIWTGVKYCVEQLSSNCHSHNVRLMKVIRADMNHAKQMMKTDPSVKIIHLIRDPRATLLSLRDASVLELKRKMDVQNHALSLCRQIETNIQISKNVSLQNPGRILTVRYEDIVESPVKATEQMYKFLGLRMTSRIKDYIWNITYGGHPDTCNTCTTRSNASITASAWRGKMTFSTVFLIDQVCGKVMDILGYRRLKTKDELRDLDFSTTREIYNSTLMTLKDIEN